MYAIDEKLDYNEYTQIDVYPQTNEQSNYSSNILYYKIFIMVYK